MVHATPESTAAALFEIEHAAEKLLVRSSVIRSHGALFFFLKLLGFTQLEVFAADHYFVGISRLIEAF